MTHRYEIPERFELVDGNVVAMLTAAEANEWSAFARQNQAFKTYSVALANYQVLKTVVGAGAIDREGDLRAAVDALRDATDVLAAVARKWYSDLLAKDEHPVTDIVGTDSAKYRTER